MWGRGQRTKRPPEQKPLRVKVRSKMPEALPAGGASVASSGGAHSTPVSIMRIRAELLIQEKLHFFKVCSMDHRILGGPFHCINEVIIFYFSENHWGRGEYIE